MNNSELTKILESNFQNVDRETLDTIFKNSSFVKIDKGTELITEGKRHHYFYLMLKGGVKSCYLKDSKQVCTWFAFENEIIGTTSSIKGLASKETIELLEDSELVRFQSEKINELTQTNLSISNLMSDIWSDHAVFLEERLYQLQFMDSDEKYKALILHNPEILQRVSLTEIASFLGVSRETLSRTRAKK